MSTASKITAACDLLKERFPGLLFEPGSQEYDKDNFHFLGTASLPSVCSIRPSSVEQVGEILRIVGRDDIRCPFAVKSGGHSPNLGFSSTTGIQISMANFRDISYDEKSQTVRIGSGLTWDEVYAELEKYQITVVGGRITGVGVGLLLGGGFSWITEEYGLSVDTIVSFDLVRPDGSFVEVTEIAEPDLFFALKGGFNNFGIVTSFQMKAYPLGTVWAGVITYSLEHNEDILRALEAFSTGNTNIKAEVGALYILAGPQTIWQLLLFYNGADMPIVFQPFLDIPHLSKDAGPRTLSQFLDIVKLPPSPGGCGHTVPINQYTLPVLKKIQQTSDDFHAQALSDGRSLTATIFMIEPFINAFRNSTSSAWPHSPDRPLTIPMIWTNFDNPDDASYFHDKVLEATKTIQETAVEEGQSSWDDLFYPNYAIGSTPVEKLYGENLPRLQEIRAKVDPKDVMRLTGGFKI